jgi:hypothetical protein
MLKSQICVYDCLVPKMFTVRQWRVNVVCTFKIYFSSLLVTNLLFLVLLVIMFEVDMSVVCRL